MKKTFLYITLLFISNLLTGQTTEYFDTNWQLTSKENAAFYRVITYDKKGKPIGKVKDYYINGILYFEGKMLSTNPNSFDGVCIWYYPAGQKMEERHYVAGKVINNRVWNINGKEEGVLEETGYFFSEEYLKKTLDSYTLEINISSVVRLQDIGFSLMQEEQFKKALTYFMLSYDLAQKLKIEPFIAKNLHNISFCYRNLGNYKKALKYGDLALEEMNAQGGGEIGLSFILDNLGVIWHKLGNQEKALAYLHQALLLRKNNLGSTAQLYGQTCINIGEVKREQGHYEEASEWVNRAKEVFSALKDKTGIANCLNNLGGIYEEQGMYSKALAYFEEALNLLNQLKLTIKKANVCDNIGSIYTQKFSFAEALVWHNKALEIRKKFDLKGDLFQSYNNLAYLFNQQNNDEKALNYYFKALSISKSIESAPFEATSYINIGETYRKLDSLDNALMYAQEAIKIFESLADSSGLANAYHNIGIVYLAKSDYSVAINWFEKAAEIRKLMNLEVLLALTYNGLGQAYEKNKQEKKALQNFYLAENIQKRLGLEVNLITTYDLLATFYWRNNTLDSALYYAKAYVKLHDQILERTKGLSNRLFLSARSLNAVEVGILSAFELQDYEFAFALSEKAKARNFIDRLGERSLGRVVIPQHLEPSISTLEEQIKAIQMTLARKPALAKKNLLIQRRDSLRESLNYFYTQTRLEAPAFSNLVYPQTININQLRLALEPSEVVVSYYVGNLKTFAFLISKNDLLMYDLGQSQEIEQLIKSFLNQYISPLEKAIEKNDIVVKNKLKKTFFKLSKQLFNTLWIDLENSYSFKDKKIIVFLHNSLNYLPLGLLISDKEQKTYKEYDYLLKQYAISYYPSATVLYLKRTEKEQPIIAKKDFLGIAIEEFSKNTCSDLNLTWLPLSYCISEIETIGKLFPNNHYLLKGKEATENRLKAMKLDEFKYIHFSTHSYISSIPDYTSLLVTPSPEEDGCLQLNEFFDFDLNADLVSFSACQTGLGNLELGDGIQGFSKVLMAIGTPSLILSSWEVADASTKELFINYYAALAIDEADKFTPLRTAQLKMIQNGGEYANPYYWAPFVFIGER